jgi:hypothetical protein
MPNLTEAIIWGVLAKAIAQAAREKNADKRREKLLDVLETIVGLYRSDKEFMTAAQNLVK